MQTCMHTGPGKVAFGDEALCRQVEVSGWVKDSASEWTHPGANITLYVTLPGIGSIQRIMWISISLQK